jgi:hypothetical protein
MAFASSYSLLGYTKSGTIYTTNGSQSDVAAAIVNASGGDTVSIPAGSFTWGASGSSVSVNKAITLAGAGPSSTTINIASTGPTWGSGVINISASGAVVSGFTITQPNTGNTTAFTAGTSNGWRITNITYNSAATVGYFCYAGSYGLIDSCTLNAGGGSDELIFSRGPSDSWQTPSSMGTANAVYVEDCTFNNPGYVCDFNSNSRGVVRFCKITGQMKVDGHGVASNSPPRSVRHMEVYNNQWTAAAGYWTAMELRGGTGKVFDNVCVNAINGNVPALILNEYGCNGQWPSLGSVYQTPKNYPIADQVGVGQDPKAAGSEPYYIWDNSLGGNDWTVIGGSGVATGAIALYQSQTGNPLATFQILTDIIVADRDYFKQTAGSTFSGSSGVGRGTTAQMNAITPSKKGVGFWVTDQANWRSGYNGTSGQLYTWNGAAWVLNYTPYTYPHPLRTGSSTTTPATIPAPSNARVL